jgi:serine/threonine-protein kinase
VNRPIDTASSQQRAVGSIDDGVDCLGGNVPDNRFEPRHLREATFRQAPSNRIFGAALESRTMPRRDLIERVRKALGDRYEVITAVGRGGNASIFGAFDKAGNRVAIKVLHPELAVSVAADRFLREIRYAGKLHHPHIAPLLDSGESDYLLWLVMPYVPGESLRSALHRERRLAPDFTARLACEILEALGYAHGQGLVHRDIKPDNIVLSPDGAVLVDFGIARAIAQSEGDRVTRSGFVVGTEEYMSPEQATGADDIDGRTDLYSLGVVLFEAVTGRPPFSGPSPAVVIDMQQHHEPPDLHRLRPELAPEYAAAITRALRKRPAERWPGAEEMRQALLPFSLSGG